jgi:hypothetical protein
MIENLILKIEQYNPQADMKQIIKAYNLLKQLMRDSLEIPEKGILSILLMLR